MTGFEFGDVVLVPFPFTDQTATKKRPAVVVNSLAYHQHRPDLIVMAVTSQVQPAPALGDVPVSEWRHAGLLKPSVVKPVLTTIEARLVIKKLGRLHEADAGALKQALAVILG